MPAETIFGYTIDDHGDRLVISLYGQVAAQALERLRQGIKTGARLELAPLMSPVVSLSRLLSSAVMDEPPDSGQAAAIDEVNQTFSEFQSQLETFRKVLDQRGAAAGATAASGSTAGGTAAGSAPQSSTSKKP